MCKYILINSKFFKNKTKKKLQKIFLGMCRINKQKKTAGREIVLGPAATLNKIIKKSLEQKFIF